MWVCICLEKTNFPVDRFYVESTRLPISIFCLWVSKCGHTSGQNIHWMAIVLVSFLLYLGRSNGELGRQTFKYCCRMIWWSGNHFLKFKKSCVCLAGICVTVLEQASQIKGLAFSGFTFQSILSVWLLRV